MEDWRQDISKALANRLKGRLYRGEMMSSHTTYEIGGPADVFVDAGSLEDLQMAAEFLSSHREVPYQILGGGSNVLYPERFPGVVIHPGPGLSGIRHEGDRVIAGAGAGLMALIKQAAQWGLGGLDFLAGIPGSIGGAVKGNAGAFGRWIAECVNEVKFFDFNELREGILYADDITWSYRKTDLASHMFIYEIALTLHPCPVMECMDAVSRRLAQRMAKHPTEPSAGCIFVNPRPPDVTAGKLIDDLGFKGKRIGDALCSPHHANFIVNVGKATQADVLALIELIKQAVKERYGYDLREEIRIIPGAEKIEEKNMEEHNG